MKTALQYRVLYKYLISAADALYTNPAACSFVKDEIRKEFRATRHLYNPRMVRRQFERGNMALFTMMNLLKKQPGYEHLQFKE